MGNVEGNSVSVSHNWYDRLETNIRQISGEDFKQHCRTCLTKYHMKNKTMTRLEEKPKRLAYGY